MSANRNDNRGFTLLEMLVATAVFALLAAMAYGGLNAMIRQKEITEASQQELADFRRAITLLERDLAQVQARPIRDAVSGQPVPALTGGVAGFWAIELTRGGWRNPAGLQRSTLQRVAWSLEGGELVRLSWPVLDQAQDATPLRVVVLEDVEALDFRYLDAGNEWQEQWPSINSPSGNVLEIEETLPLAIEFRLQRDNGEFVRRLLELSQ
ncbi:MAG: type II secretion system minor pseudopilin GspJ [Gammaproteobacteria bacterium]|nr:type II secretion system minor pseudopilin GspJ [Gammaproteobacteria bacterium]